MKETDKIEIKSEIKQNVGEPDKAENLIIADDTNELTCIEFNSADDVRQGIKLFAKGMISEVEDETNIIPQQKTEAISGDSGILGTNDYKFYKDSKPTTLGTSKTLKLASGIGDAVKVQKRLGRPPKVGPSKKQRKQRDSSIYFEGKLSNVQRGYESDSSHSSY